MSEDKPKFTPGPWFKRGKRVFWQRPDRELPKDNLWNGTICICATTEDDVPEANEEARTNAALIAAAPEMYEIILKLAHFLQYGNGGPLTDRINRLISMINKE